VDKSNGYAMVPPLPAAWASGAFQRGDFIETRTAFARGEIKDFPAVAAWLKAKADPVAAFVNSQLSAETVAELNDYKVGAPVSDSMQKRIVADLNQIIRH